MVYLSGYIDQLCTFLRLLVMSWSAEEKNKE